MTFKTGLEGLKSSVQTFIRSARLNYGEDNVFVHRSTDDTVVVARNSESLNCVVQIIDADGKTLAKAARGLTMF